YYQNHIDSYMNPESISVTYFYCKSEKERKKTQKLLSQRPLKFETDSSIVLAMNKKNTDALQIEKLQVYKGENTVIDSLIWKPGTIMQMDSLTVVYVNNVFPSEPKPFDTVKSQIITQYQAILELNLMEYLQTKYPVTIFEDVLSQLRSYYK